MRVRTADPGERTSVLGVLDAGLLDADADDVADRIAAESVLVAAAGGPVVGALVADPRAAPTRIAAVAVRPGRRGQGIGTALVAAAADRWGRLAAEFDPAVRPFYESLGFAIERRGERCRGTVEPPVR